MLAVGETLGTIIYIAGLLLSAAVLLSKKKVKVANLDDALSTTATQGAYIPLVIGRQRVGPVVLWVEDLTNDSGGGGGLDEPGQAAGGKGGGGTPSQPSYIEASLHGICVGPASELRAIYQNNERIWEGSLTPINAPSGVSTYNVTEPDGGTSTFKIYWGFSDDPVISELGASERHGVATRYTHSFKILWTSKRLGQSRQWPRLEYEVVCPCYSQIASSPSEIPRTGNDAEPTYASSAWPFVQSWKASGDRVELSLWAIDGNARKLAIWGGELNTNILAEVAWLAEFPIGGVVKVWVPDNSLVTTGGNAFSPSSPSYGSAPPAGWADSNGASIGLPNGQWKYFRIGGSQINFNGFSFGSYFASSIWLPYVVPRFLEVSLAEELDPSEVIENASTTAPTSIGAAWGTTTGDWRGLGYVQPVTVSGSDGVNVIHMIDQILFSKFPYGAGRNRQKFDSYSIDVAAEQLQAERIRGALAIVDGESIESVLAQIMQDIGLLIPLNPETGLYTFRLLRYSEGAEDMNEEVLLRAPEQVHVHGSRPADVVAFTFKDRERNYREVPVKVHDNGQISENEVVRAKKVPIEVTNDRDSVGRLAPRRQQEALGSLTSTNFEMNHRAILAVPGSRFACSAIEDPNVVFVVMSVRRNLNSSKVEIEALIDTYDPEEGTAGAGDFSSRLIGESRPSINDRVRPLDALEDTFAVELPRLLSSNVGTVEVFFGASRKAAATRYARVWASRDDLTFELVGDAPIVARGVLSEALAADGASIQPSVGFETDYDIDIDQIEDLTLNEAAWRAGRQVMLIGEELIYLKDGYINVPGEPSAGLLTGLIRGRAGTDPAAHAIGTPFFVFLSHRAVKLTSDLFVAGKTIYYKLQAAEIRRLQPIDDIASTSLALTGKAFKPKKPSALRLGAFERGYAGADDPIRFDWNYHSYQFPMTGLGDQPCGNATGLSEPLGHFIVRLKDNGGAEVLETTTREPFFEVSAATRAAHSLDSGSTWSIEVEHVAGSFTSDTASLTIQKI